jgi:hypothetical protein
MKEKVCFRRPFLLMGNAAFAEEESTAAERAEIDRSTV